MNLSKTKRDILQVQAFHAFYKAHRMVGMTKEIAFAGAVEKTSDEAFERIAANPEQIAALKLWLKTGRRRRKSQKGQIIP